METLHISCPDPEALAAWLDQGVDAGERERIEAHLATCEDCRFVVAGVLETQSAVPGAHVASTVASTAGSGRVLRFPTRQVMWAGTMLAAAAALMLVVNVPRARWPWTTGADSKLADLAAAVRDARTVEARLTGGFSYGPINAAKRSGGSSAASDNWSLLAIASKIREDAAGDPTADNLHALGVAHLLLGEHDAAVRAFEDAIAQGTAKPQYLSDLSAAYLARGRELDRPDDFPRALDGAERALKGNEALLEARFNRALALEALHLNDQARAAYEDYLTRDSGSGWASEARTRLQKLQQSSSAHDFARNNSPPLITDRSVEAALDWLLRQGLPQWADAILAEDTGRASLEHLRLTEYAKQISATTGDPFATAVVGDIEPLTAEGAARVRTLTQALGALEADDMAAADKGFTAACTDVGLALTALCAVNRGAIAVIKRQDADAERLAADASRIARDHQWIYIANLAKRLAGFRLLFKGDYAATVAPYAESFEAFQSAKYLGAACQLALQLADLADVVGLSHHGWRWRIRAAELAEAVNSSACTYMTRLQLASTAAGQRYDAAASVIADSIDASNLPDLSDLRRIALEVVKARIALASDQRDVLSAAIESALAMAAASSDFRARRLAPDLLVLKGTMQYRAARLDDARQTLTTAIEQMGPERAASHATALVVRARAAADDPQRLAEAERDLQTALDMLGSRVGAGPAQPLRLEEAAEAFSTIASLVEASDRLQGTQGVWLVERLRQVLNGVPPGSTLSLAALDAVTARTAPGALVINYLLSRDSVLAWVHSASGWQFAERRVDSATITRLLNSLTVEINRSPTREDLWRPELAQLYDLLLRDLPGIDTATDVAVVPDGILNRVPFGSLYDTRAGRYLFERATVRLAPNLAFTFAPARDAAAPKTAAVVGDPRVTGAGARRFRPLPRARAEAVGVARLYQRATLVIDTQATKARVLDALNNADVVHYAGHAVAPDQQGARLLLAGEAGDPRAGLAPGDLATRLTRPVRVVLAACETGASSTDRATGVSSLATALLRAGALSVVATLWDVDDAAGESFFLNVHRALAGGNSTATAVAHAQRACRADAGCRRAAGIWVGTGSYGAN